MADHLPRPDADAPTLRGLPLTSAPAPAPVEPDSLYARVGGEPFFTRLVAAFYARVADDEVLRPLYPDADLSAATERLRLFLIQYWGGPTTYSAERGHPRLRMRHAPFAVGTIQIQAWLTNMRGALDQVTPDPVSDAELWSYFERAAPMMRNVEG